MNKQESILQAEGSDEDSFRMMYNSYEKQLAAAEPKDRNKIQKNFQRQTQNIDPEVKKNVFEAMDKESEAKNMGGMMNYNMGGSMLMPPEREGYSRAGLVKLIIGAFTKTPTEKAIVKQAKDAHKSVEDLSMEMPKKEAMEQTAEKMDMPISSIQALEKQFARESGGGKADTFFDEIRQTYRAITKEGTQGQQAAEEFGGGKETRASRIKGAKFFGVGAGTVGLPVAGMTAYNNLTDTESGNNEERINPEDYPVYKKGSESAKAFRESQRKAKKEKKEFFEFEGREYNVKEAKNMGGKMKIKYAEGGSMLVPPEMEAEQDMPVDTYDNIPPDEMAAAEASQLPDEEMEDSYLEYVLDESLDQEDQEYLMSVLESDERLSGIFDKVMDVAGEFSGEGEVDGPGTGVSDSIPARLSDGEFVVTEKATDQIGADNLQTMMDDAEQAYDGGYMKKAFGGMVDDVPTDDRKEDEEINSMMIASNQMPSVRPR
jgi:hypothetical protein|tara:strand:- start:3048 stop:4508 length:1461 start_codon:yes stop_codon:yes gene_type:complete